MLLVIIGFISGIISGMGIGGGTILIPALIFLADLSQHEAQSINLFSFIPTAIIAIIIHAKNEHIHFKLAIQMALCGLVGAIGGSMLAINISSESLQKLFGVFLLIMGAYELIRKSKKRE